MDDLNQLYKKCGVTIDLVFSSVGLAEDTEEIKNNLLLSVYLNFIKQVFSAPENKELLDKLGTLNGNVSFEDFERVINEGKNHFEQNSSGFPDVLKKSTVSALQDFITELEPKLTPEKVAELRKLIDESF